jgi:hypothetical protein
MGGQKHSLIKDQTLELIVSGTTIAVPLDIYALKAMLIAGDTKNDRM